MEEPVATDPSGTAEPMHPGDRDVLTTTRKRTYRIGSDLAGCDAPIGWSFVLPTRAVGSTIEIAADPAGTFDGVADDPLTTAGPEAVRACAAGSIDAADLSSVDISNASDAFVSEIAVAVAAALAPQGVVRATEAWSEPLAAAGLSPRLRAWASPPDDPVAVIPAHDSSLIEHFQLAGRHQSGYAHVLGRRGRGPEAGSVVLFGAGGAPSVNGPPAWLVDIAATSGIDISGHRWGLWARRDFESQKAVFFLHGEHDSGVDPDLVVKVPRSAEYNHRLTTEAEVMESVRASPELAATVPATAFSGWHAGLFVLASRGIAGPSMPLAVDEPGGQRLPERVIDWVTMLGAETAQRIPGNVMAEALGDVVTRFDEIYQPERDLADFLRRQIDLVGEVADIPAVTMHGNVTDWNVIVPPDGPIVLVDWEFAEPLAPPLWDLFHFLRMDAWRPTRGWRRRIPRWPARTDTFLRGGLRRGRNDHRMALPVERYCDQVGVPPEVIAPLFHLCWAHLCLNEATHQTPDTLGRGPSMAALRRGVDLASRDRLDDLFVRDPA